MAVNSGGFKLRSCFSKGALHWIHICSVFERKGSVQNWRTTKKHWTNNSGNHPLTLCIYVYNIIQYNVIQQGIYCKWIWISSWMNLRIVVNGSLGVPLRSLRFGTGVPQRQSVYESTCALQAHFMIAIRASQTAIPSAQLWGVVFPMFATLSSWLLWICPTYRHARLVWFKRKSWQQQTEKQVYMKNTRVKNTKWVSDLHSAELISIP